MIRFSVPMPLPASLLAASLVSAPAAAGPLCKPALTFGPSGLSGMPAAQRLWSARLDVDASRCASAAGTFTIDFVRGIEFGPDLPFTQRFTWRDGRQDVSLDFSANEAVLDFALGDVSSCACRR